MAKVRLPLSTLPHKLSPPTQLEIASEITYIFLITFGRASVLFLYRRVFTLSNPWFRLSWSVITTSAVGFCIALLVTVIFQCQSQPLFTLSLSPGKCLTDSAAPMAMGYVNASIDFVILLLPTRMVWMLQMPVRRRLAVCGIFGLGMMCDSPSPFSSR